MIDDVAQKGERILVHCHQGISRSATIIIAYVMRRDRLTLQKAYELVKSRRELVFPNYGFWLYVPISSTLPYHPTPIVVM
jgi:protein-tyrosine phosphatase